jgi:hypothetical protein
VKGAHLAIAFGNRSWDGLMTLAQGIPLMCFTTWDSETPSALRTMLTAPSGW